LLLFCAYCFCCLHGGEILVYLHLFTFQMRAVKVNRKRWQMGGVVDGEEVIGWRAGGAARISQSKQFGKQCNSKEPAMQLQVAYLHSVPQKYAEGNDFPPLRDNENKLNNRRGT